jgi:hypothetical protein
MSIKTSLGNLKQSKNRQLEFKMNKDYVLVRPNTAINIIEPIEENHSFQITCEELEKILKDHANKKVN